MTYNLAYLDESAAAGWERTLYAFLAEKERRSGSQRTVQSYSRMLRDFFGRAGKTPDEVTSQDVFRIHDDCGTDGFADRERVESSNNVHLQRNLVQRRC